MVSKGSNDSALLWCVPATAAAATYYLSRRTVSTFLIRWAAAEEYPPAGLSVTVPYSPRLKATGGTVES